MKFKLDPLIIYILVAIALAYFLPAGWLDDYGDTYDRYVGWGVSLIFFLYGIKIPVSEFVRSFKKWKIHLSVQGVTYLLFPLLVLSFCSLFISDWSHPLVIGFLFLSVLPSTVSSSVVMTSWAEGNVAIAVFNSFITGILGIILTPVWMGAILDVDDMDFDLWSVYSSLFTDVVLPLGLGIFVQRWLRKYILKYPDIISNYDKLIIFLIIFKAFSIVFRDQLFSMLDAWSIIYMLLALILIFLVVSLIILALSRLLKLEYAEKMSLYFCAIQKSFVHATVFSKIIFKSSPQLGFILLPTMIYHLFQIILTSILAEMFKSRRKI